MKLAEGTSDMSGDARLEQYKQALKQRDDRINNLKTELETNIASLEDRLASLKNENSKKRYNGKVDWFDSKKG